MAGYYTYAPPQNQLDRLSVAVCRQQNNATVPKHAMHFALYLKRYLAARMHLCKIIFGLAGICRIIFILFVHRRPDY